MWRGGHGAEVMWGMVRDYHVVYCVVYGALCGVGIVLWGCLLGCMGGGIVFMGEWVCGCGV